MRTIACAILWCISAFAQPPAAPAPEVKPEDKCSIEGTVVNAITGAPLKKAHLILHPIGQPNGIPYGTISETAGHFLLDGLDPGQYNFSASRNGYVEQAYSPSGDLKHTALLTLGRGQKLKDVVFKLTPQGVISGRILDEDGEPLEYVEVKCTAFSYRKGKRQLTERNQVSTNDLGEFRVSGLAAGKYAISATRQDWQMYSRQPERTVGSAQAIQASGEEYVTTYYPSGAAPDSASLIEIAPGAQVSGINITLARTRAIHIKGRVTGLAGSTRRSMGVMLFSGGTMYGAPSAFGRVLDSQGSFELRGVVPGSYVLQANTMQDGKRYSARLPLVAADSNIEGIELVLRPPIEFQGRVIVEKDGSLKGEPVNLQFRSKTSEMWGGAFAQVNDDLSFKVTNAGMDNYDLSVFNLPENMYLKSIHIGQQDVTETGVDLTQGVPAEELTVLLSPAGGVIEGSVKNAKDELAIGAKITLIPDKDHQSISRLYKSTDTDQNGHFTIKAVTPGKYKIYAWENIEEGAWEDPDFVKPYEAKGQTLSIQENSHEALQLIAVSAEATAGQKPAQ